MAFVDCPVVRSVEQDRRGMVVLCMKDLEYECPTCKAPVGQLCTTMGGVWMGRVHIDRRYQHDLPF